MTSPAELQAIRERDKHGQGGDTMQAADRRTLLALYDAQSDEVRRLREGLQYIVNRGYTGAAFVASQLLDGKSYGSQP